MCNNNNNNNNNIRKPRSSVSSVHFPPDDLLITSIHTRPSTDMNDIPTLYYSSDDIKHFKQTYKDRLEQLALLYGNTNIHPQQFMHQRQRQQRHNSSSVLSPKGNDVMITADQLLLTVMSSRRVNNNIQRRQPAIITCDTNNNNNETASEEVILSYEDLTSYEAPDISLPPVVL